MSLTPSSCVQNASADYLSSVLFSGAINYLQCCSLVQWRTVQWCTVQFCERFHMSYPSSPPLDLPGPTPCLFSSLHPDSLHHSNSNWQNCDHDGHCSCVFWPAVLSQADTLHVYLSLSLYLCLYICVYMHFSLCLYSVASRLARFLHFNLLLLLCTLKQCRNGKSLSCWLNSWEFMRQASETVENHNTVEKSHPSWDSLWHAGETVVLCKCNHCNLISSFKL